MQHRENCVLDDRIKNIQLYKIICLSLRAGEVDSPFLGAVLFLIFKLLGASNGKGRLGPSPKGGPWRPEIFLKKAVSVSSTRHVIQAYSIFMSWDNMLAIYKYNLF